MTWFDKNIYRVVRSQVILRKDVNFTRTKSFTMESKKIQFSVIYPHSYDDLSQESSIYNHVFIMNCPLIRKYIHFILKSKNNIGYMIYTWNIKNCFFMISIVVQDCVDRFVRSIILQKFVLRALFNINVFVEECIWHCVYDLLFIEECICFT